MIRLFISVFGFACIKITHYQLKGTVSDILFLMHHFHRAMQKLNYQLQSLKYHIGSDEKKIKQGNKITQHSRGGGVAKKYLPMLVVGDTKALCD